VGGVISLSRSDVKLTDAKSMCFSELVQLGIKLFAGCDQTDSPSLDSQWLAEHLVFGDRQYGLDWDQRWQNKKRKIQPRILKKFIQKIEERKAGVPLAYLIGEKYFLGYRFLMTRGVLVPRPETEILVEKAVEILVKGWDTAKASQKIKGPYSVMDLGSGSGCIGIGLYLHLKKNLVERAKNHDHLKMSPAETALRLTLVDQSKKAIKLIKKNIAYFEVQNTEVICSRVEKLNIKPNSQNLILANPPYIGRQEWVQPSVVRFEPKAALFSGESGYRATRIWAKLSFDWLKPGGWIGFEINPLHLAQFEQDLSRLGFSQIRSVKDYSGFDRFVFAEKVETGAVRSWIK
jgi:release factor glutamine methyltransferase